MVRRAVWEELGGFDEGFYPLWFEDVDFCRRQSDRGYRVYYVPELWRNTRAATRSRSLPVEMRRFYWYRSLLRYSAKHFRPLAFRAVCLAVVTGSVLRLHSGIWPAAEPQAPGSLWARSCGSPAVVCCSAGGIEYGCVQFCCTVRRMYGKFRFSGSSSWRITTSFPSR